MKFKNVLHIIALILFLLSGFFINNLKTNNNILDWLPAKHPHVEKVLAERKDGLLQKIIFLGIETPKPFWKDSVLKKIFKMESWLLDSTLVDSVFGLGYVLENTPRANPLVVDLFDTPSEADRLQNLFYKEKDHSAFWAADSQTVFISVSIVGIGDSLDQKESKIVSQIKEKINDGSFPAETRLAGVGVIAKTLNDLVLQKGLVMLCLSYLVIMILLFISLKNVRNFGIAMVVLTLSSFTTHGLMGFLGIPLNLMTIAVGVLVLVLGIADILHISKHLESHPDEGLKAVFWPCLWTSITTGVGFLSLKISGLPILNQFGTASTIGILCTLFWSFYLYGVFQKKIFQNTKGIKKTQTKISWSLKVLPNLQRIKWLLPLSAMALSVAVALGLPSLKVDTNLLDYIPKESKAIQDTKWFSDKNMGVNRIDLNLTKSTMMHSKIEQVLIDHGYVDFFWLQKEKQKILSIGTPFNIGSNKLNEWQRSLEKVYFGNSKGDIGGFASLFALIFRELLDTQVKSGLTSLTLILLMLAIILKRVKWIVAGVIANVLPLLSILTLLIYSGIGIDITTVCVTILTLGIVVDDTIHLLWNIEKCEQNKNATEMQGVLRAVTSTSLILGMGFSFLASSSILSLHLFGLVLAVGVFMAWIFDILLIPWCYPNIKDDLQ